MRYAPEKVVALLDTERAGETEQGFPIFGSVDDALRLEPNTALVGVATSGGRFPPAFRAQIRSCVEHGLMANATLCVGKRSYTIEPAPETGLPACAA